MANIFPIDFEEKLTMAQDDYILFSDSEDGNKIKKAQYKNLKGEQGDPGTPGADGSAATITVGSVSTGAAGSSATVVNSGTSSAAVLDFTIPQGAKGEPGVDGQDGVDGAAATITVGTTTTLPAGSSATVTNVGTSQDAILNFGIPKGDSGTGSGDVIGPASSTDGHLAVFDGATGKLIKDGGIVPTVPTNVSDFNNDAGYLTSSTGVTSVNGNHGAVTVNEPVVSSSTPATPTEGMIWYDTTNDVLKTYDGSNWNECGAGGGGVEVFDITQYGTNTDWTDIITSCANNNTLTIILDIWEDDYTTQTGWVKWLVTEYDDGGTSGIGRISAIALFNLNGVGPAVPYPKSNKLVATFNATTKYCTGVTRYYTEFVPTNSGSTGNVLTKTANGYEWSAPSGGDVMVSSQSGNILTSGMKIWAGLETDYGNLGTYDSNCLYLVIE